MNKVLGEIWDFIKINFKWLLLAALFLFIFLKKCDNDAQPPTVVHDTVVIVHEYQSAPYIPPVINVLPAKPTVINQPQYQPDTSSIEALRKQFNDLVAKHTARRTYNDSLKIDSIGWVNVKDTVSENKLESRSFNYNIREREILKTVTLPYKPRNQVYVGISVESLLNAPLAPSDVSLDFILKNKNDVGFGVGGSYNLKAKQPGVRLILLKKLSLRKQ